MKKFTAVLFLMSALVTIAVAAKPAGSAKSENAATAGTLKVMSYNIRQGVADDGTNSWQYRYPATAMMIEDQKPDIFGVQEAYDFQLRFITDNCRDYKCVGVGREDGKTKGEHMSVFYNKKTVSLLKWGTFWLSETPETPSMGWDAACKRTATWALMKCKKTGRQFYYVNTHLDHKGAKAQKEGLALIVARINSMNSKGLPMVLTGDFNITSDNPALKDLDSMMKSARVYAEKSDNKATYNGWGKSYSLIDYIYYSGFSKCPMYKTVDTPYAERTFVSDHFPIVAELVF